MKYTKVLLSIVLAILVTKVIASNGLLESYNRSVYKFNSVLDKAFVRPAARTYRSSPGPFKTAFHNFVGNISDFSTLTNDVFQLHGESCMRTIMRISINSTFGIFGILDIATALGLYDQPNSFGHTLRVYGWTNSSYFVIPFLGPSTIRDAIGMIPDAFLNPVWYITPGYDYYWPYLLTAGGFIDQRSKYLDFDSMIDSSLDPYITVKSAYLQATGQDHNNNDVSIDELIK